MVPLGQDVSVWRPLAVMVTNCRSLHTQQTTPIASKQKELKSWVRHCPPRSNSNSKQCVGSPPSALLELNSSSVWWYLQFAQNAVACKLRHNRTIL